MNKSEPVVRALITCVWAAVLFVGCMVILRQIRSTTPLNTAASGASDPSDEEEDRGGSTASALEVIEEEGASSITELPAIAQLNAHLAYMNDSCAPVSAEEAHFTLNAIKQAKLMVSPYPHIYINNIYHPRVYACIIKEMPEGNSSAYVKTQKKPRFSIRLTKTLRSTSGLANLPFWQSFYTRLGSSEVALAWVQRFNRVLKKRGNIKRANQIGYTMDLSRDLSGWFIDPHTDSVNKLVTTLYYLPFNETNSDLGTAIFNGNDRGKSLRLVKIAPFVPNSVLAFAPCSRSWHGVSQKALSKVARRDSIQGFVRPIKSGSSPSKSGC